MNKIIGFIGGALVAGALTFGGSATAATATGGLFAAGAPWSAESLQKDASTAKSSSAGAVDLTAITSYNLGW